MTKTQKWEVYGQEKSSDNQIGKVHKIETFATEQAAQDKAKQLRAAGGGYYGVRSA